jgi:hypothetical protein
MDTCLFNAGELIRQPNTAGFFLSIPNQDDNVITNLDTEQNSSNLQVYSQKQI